MEQPPHDTAEALKEYLVRQLSLLENLIKKSNKLPVQMNLPPKPQPGVIYYFGRVIGTTITAIGFWGYTATGWRRLD